jgi:hypothetical protein
MDADRIHNTYDPKIAPMGSGRVACPPSAATGSAFNAAPGSAAAPVESQKSPSEAFKSVSSLIAELKEYAAYYLSAKIDGIKITARNIGIFATLGIVGLIAGSAFISTAAVLLMVGAAWGLGRLFSPSYDETKFLWLGALIVGLVFFTTIALGVIFGLKKLTGTFKKATVQKYEQRQNWERGQFGHNVRERCAQAKS